MWDGNRSDDVVAIHITSVLRTKEMKLNLYSELVKVLTVNPGVRKEDIFVTIVDNTPENWSFGKGLAQLSTSNLLLVRNRSGLKMINPSTSVT
jgi:phenylpyruvate tautomerase PptA (4-oxalocrotonate tautomerase family)